MRTVRGRPMTTRPVSRKAGDLDRELQDLLSAGPGTGSVPPRARFVSGLPELVLDGDWNFHLSPSLYAAPAGVEDEDFDDSGWATLPVPSSWVMHGHGKPAYTNV